MGDKSPQRWSKAWVRDNWDYDQNTATGEVVLVKLLHEWYIAVPGLVFGGFLWGVFTAYGRPEFETVMAILTAIGSGYALFFPKLWCGVVSNPDSE